MGSYKVNLMSVKTFGRRFTYTSFVFLEGILLLIHIKFKFWIEASEANSSTWGRMETKQFKTCMYGINGIQPEEEFQTNAKSRRSFLGIKISLHSDRWVVFPHFHPHELKLIEMTNAKHIAPSGSQCSELEIALLLFQFLAFPAFWLFAALSLLDLSSTFRDLFSIFSSNGGSWSSWKVLERKRTPREWQPHREWLDFHLSKH